MKSLRNSVLILLLAVCLAPAQTVSEAGSDTYVKIREAGKLLKCQCNCSYTIADCNMLNCHYREQVKPDIKELVEAGVPVAAVVEQIIAKYGSALRTSPETDGFGLFGWAMPFAAVLLGLIVAPIVVWRWKAKHDDKPAKQPVKAADVERFREQIEKDVEGME